MRRACVLLIFCLLDGSNIFCQATTATWTWVSGDSISVQFGVYGFKGVPGVFNKPGARTDAMTWTDGNGNLWLMGGFGNAGSGKTGYLNDLWKFNITTNVWTWVGGDSIVNQDGIPGNRGVGNTTNYPSARYGGVDWIDKEGNLWLMGGMGYPKTGINLLNDLWKYTPSRNQWTWVSGDISSNQTGIYGTKGVSGTMNKPGGRSGAVDWTDDMGNLWLMGGTGMAGNAIGYLNDLWKFDILSGEWTWVSGDNIVNQIGNYNTMGMASALSKPGARTQAVSWTDTSANLWLFGGLGYNATGGASLNDLWKFSPKTNEWTWVSGDNDGTKLYSYGKKGVASSTNLPPVRYAAKGWTDKLGNLWLMGGDNRSRGLLNDLWKFDVAGSKWTWISGDSAAFVTGVYGIKGIGGEANKGGSRYGHVSWTDTSGQFWFLGGHVYASSGTIGFFNDLWKITINNTFYRDADGDSFGDINNTILSLGFTPPPGYVSDSLDCNDSKLLYADKDGDGYGAGLPVACGVTNNTDCNDSSALVHPGATEICGNGIDDNCDGLVDEGCSILPGLSINDVTVYEAQGIAKLTVSIPHPCSQRVRVTFDTEEGSATEKGEYRDYKGHTGHADIEPGSLTTTVSIDIIQDKLKENPEYFNVVLSRPVNAVIAKGKGRVTILDGGPQTKTGLNKNENNGLGLIIMPNPSNSVFMLNIQSNNTIEKIALRVIDLSGKVIEEFNNLTPNQDLKIGSLYRPGVYVVEMIQGSQRKQLKLIKQPD